MNTTGTELTNKTAFITGAASGIGKATALLFASHGARVVVADMQETHGKETVREIETAGGKALFVKCNVTDEKSVAAAIQHALQTFSELHIVVNNAGITVRKSVLDISVEDWDRVVAVNLRGVFLVSKYALPHLIKAGGGSIVHMGSGWGIVGGKDAAVYCATKGAVVNLTRAMALDHAHQHIRVNAVCPGDTDTPLLADEGRQLGQDRETLMREAAIRPMGRVGTPREIAEAILFLASGRSSFVTGTTLVVDGGGLAT